ncbi:Uncharacterized protein APZ42_002030, partial [Daphnia magna]
LIFHLSGLESFWQSAFRWFFQPFLASHGHLWTLEPTELPPLSIEWPWHSVTYFAKVRFQCQVKFIVPSSLTVAIYVMVIYFK